MSLYSFVLLFLAFYVQGIFGNVEKTIFIAPSAITIPSQSPSFDNLQLQSLSPTNSTVRTELQAKFPSETSPRGSTSWFILQQLVEGQRYEVRVCWAATQPTSFRLETHEITDVFASPALVTSLAEYAEAQQTEAEYVGNNVIPAVGGSAVSGSQSILLLSISAAADYYTTNKSLMENAPPVLIDIILDPFIFNVFPRSLVPTAAYLSIVAVGSFFIARFVNNWLQAISRTDVQKKYR